MSANKKGIHQIFVHNGEIYPINSPEVKRILAAQTLSAGMEIIMDCSDKKPKSKKKADQIKDRRTRMDQIISAPTVFSAPLIRSESMLSEDDITGIVEAASGDYVNQAIGPVSNNPNENRVFTKEEEIQIAKLTDSPKAATILDPDGIEFQRKWYIDHCDEPLSETAIKFFSYPDEIFFLTSSRWSKPHWTNSFLNDLAEYIRSSSAQCKDVIRADLDQIREIHKKAELSAPYNIGVDRIRDFDPDKFEKICARFTTDRINDIARRIMASDMYAINGTPCKLSNADTITSSLIELFFICVDDTMTTDQSDDPNVPSDAIMDSTKIPTPNGIYDMGDIQVGDSVFGSDGKPTTVTAVYPQPPVPVAAISIEPDHPIDIDQLGQDVNQYLNNPATGASVPANHPPKRSHKKKK